MSNIPPIGKCEHNVLFSEDCMECQRAYIVPSKYFGEKEDFKPEQYRVGIDTFERMKANATLEEAMGFIRWNIDKYNTRKKGQDISDYKKIIDYANEAIWWLENKENK